MSRASPPEILPVGFDSKSYPFHEVDIQKALEQLQDGLGESFAGAALRIGKTDTITFEAAGILAGKNNQLIFVPEIDDDVVAQKDLKSIYDSISYAHSIFDNYKGPLRNDSKASLRALVGNTFKEGGFEITTGRRIDDLYPEFLEQWKKNIPELNKFCEKYGVILMLENHPLLTMRELRAIGKLTEEYPNIMLLGDPANCTLHVDGVEAIKQEYWKGRIGGVHIKQAIQGVPLMDLQDGGSLDMKDVVRMVYNHGGGFAVPYFTVIETDKPRKSDVYNSDQYVRRITKNTKYLQDKWAEVLLENSSL